MFLSDRDIQNALISSQITIQDFDPDRLQPASYDILLGNDFMFFEKEAIGTLDPKSEITPHMRNVHIPDGEFLTLHANEFVLGVTRDYFGVGPAHCCHIMGKSSLARLGLIIHTTAGFVDPGNELNATLELLNINSLPLKLYPGMKIAQIAFCELKTPAVKPYGHPELKSKYYQSKTVESSQMWQNFEEGRNASVS